MPVGRPRQFDRAQALERAMDVFWTRGYEAASVRELLASMGINRGSMYDTFGDKRALFLEALALYQQKVVARLHEVLRAPGAPLANIQRALETVAALAGSGRCRGCLFTNTTVELAAQDGAVAEVMRGGLRAMEGAMREALRRAVAAGELPPGADVRRLARFLTNTLQGLVVISKARLGQAAVRDVIGVAMGALRRRPA